MRRYPQRFSDGEVMRSTTPADALQGKQHAARRDRGQGIWHRLLRDWAAKGTNLLGVRAVIAETYERIHRSNLVGMGVLPLQFLGEDNRESLGLTGDETFTITGVADLQPRQEVTVEVARADGSKSSFTTRCRIDTLNELEYFRAGGILHYVLRRLAA
jgi:aconitate hydratase